MNRRLTDKVKTALTWALFFSGAFALWILSTVPAIVVSK